MIELVYPELSFELLGSAFKVFNTIGYGLHEKYYHRSYEEELAIRHIPFEREVTINLMYGDKHIGKGFLDFLIDKKIVVEWKIGYQLGQLPMRQVYGYLRGGRCELAIILYVTRDGIKYRRVLNPDFKHSDKIRTH